MARKVSISFNWQGPMDYDQALARVRLADEAGVDTAWVAEAWGRDCFTILALMARETRRMQLGTGIVNTYSRTPAALAQHFATLDELSGGRMVIGLGTSGYRVIEHWHGIPLSAIAHAPAGVCRDYPHDSGRGAPQVLWQDVQFATRFSVALSSQYAPAFRFSSPP